MARSRGTRYSGSAKDFKQFVRLMGLTHVRTSPYYPQSNGKLERWHGTLKRECIRPTAPASLDEARRRVAEYVEHYNHVRLNAAIGYLTPADKLNGLAQVIFDERDRKLDEARQRRQQARQALREVARLPDAIDRATNRIGLGGG